MRALVAYASRHGATAGIAQRIAKRLNDSGVTADVIEVSAVGDVAGYDAYVIGSAAYMYHWLKDATKFATRHQEILARKPVWLFSSGPLGTDLVDEDGNDLLEVSRPREFDDLAQTLQPAGEKVFFGAWDPEAPAVGVAERFMKAMPKGKEALPAGDFRDWDAIDEWADAIVAELRAGDHAGAPDGR